MSQTTPIAGPASFGKHLAPTRTYEGSYHAAMFALSNIINSINGLRGLDMEIAAYELAAAQINFERAKSALTAFGETGL